MCNIGGQTPAESLRFLMGRAAERRKADALRASPSAQPDPSRPAPEERIDSTLAYAISFAGKRYAGYSGKPGGMSYQTRDQETNKTSNVFMTTDQAKRRQDRIARAGIVGTKPGVPGMSGSGRPYCRCAEPAALSIAMSYGETVDNLVFAAFYAPQVKGGEPAVVFCPCPNCSVWLNKYSGGYFVSKTDHEALEASAAANLEAAHMNKPTRNLNRRDSNAFIIRPPRDVNDIPFSLDGKVYVLRCFKCA
ncbi:hypothetical protein ACQW02_00010 [Humitalea sp. 24SJ18S-53]|uniref:hypothetical protein n=1 Tax=Humitalea sp. 24SJ18S-53 TaxID=3422307 RepID=UPI003D6708E4